MAAVVGLVQVAVLLAAIQHSVARYLLVMVARVEILVTPELAALHQARFLGQFLFLAVLAAQQIMLRVMLVEEWEVQATLVVAVEAVLQLVLALMPQLIRVVVVAAPGHFVEPLARPER